MLTVSAERDYSRRVALERRDELGTLVDNFNEMLNQIEMRDAELQEKQERLNYLAYHDPLTGLANRLLFDDRLQHALNNAPRWRCCSSTWIASRTSTIPLAIKPETAFSRR